LEALPREEHLIGTVGLRGGEVRRFVVVVGIIRVEEEF